MRSLLAEALLHPVAWPKAIALSGSFASSRSVAKGQSPLAVGSVSQGRGGSRVVTEPMCPSTFIPT
ncbi:MAG: hypothetical protein F6K26_27570 [Moorea sp. SIO2I5]|nr:hypothetical protein [Moorena sp. SIO2I5]